MLSVPASLYEPERGDRPVQVVKWTANQLAWEPPRSNCFILAYIERGAGAFWADAAQHAYQSASLICLTPYQLVRLEPTEPTRATVIQFHANFLCVETFHAETGCASALFNDLYQPPTVLVPAEELTDVAHLLRQLQVEQDTQPLAFAELMLATLKILLIRATRWKTAAGEAHNLPSTGSRHPTIQALRPLLEAHYRHEHSPTAYAQWLHLSPKNLGRIVREQLGKTLSELIRERVILHAKWQLLHTEKPVKEVAREVGFPDELYFSRVFKKATGFSPTFFREFETQIRGGSNLSMPLRPAPIPSSATDADNSPS